MPNRILRDITDSEKVDQLSAQAEVMMYRLFMKADDYGVFHAKPSLIKAALFPLRLDSIRETDITRWLAECEKAGLIAFYNAESKPLLVIINFGQRMRNKKNRFPPPPAHLLQCAASCRELPPEEETRNIETRNEVEVFATNLISDRHFYEQIGQAWGIDKVVYKKMIDGFKLFLSSKGKVHPNQGEFKSHFFNWGARKYQSFKEMELVVDPKSMNL